MDNKPKKGFLILFGVIVTVFIFGLIQFFQLGFESGSLYSQYSSFRSDPIGVRAFFNALEASSEVSVSRNIKSITQLELEGDSTLFFCGATTGNDPEEVIEKLEGNIKDGGRMIIAFYPAVENYSFIKELQNELEKEDEEEPENSSEKNAEVDGKKKKGKKAGSAKKDEGECGKEDEKSEKPFCAKMVSIEERWGFSYAFVDVQTISKEFKSVTASLQVDDSGLPDSLSWHSRLYFDKLSDDWRVLYAWKDRAVIIERSLGEGTIVLSSDNYLLSNEAMHEERHPELLAWLVGSSSHVIFDETHLGHVEQQGVMVLMRQYNLEGILGAFILIAALFVWKNALSLAPKRNANDSDSTSISGGKDSTAGLTNLLRRSIPARNIISVCAMEWTRAFVRDPEDPESKMAKVNEVVERERTLAINKRNPVAAYRTIYKILSEREK